jgi:hypothetical protein
LRSTFVISSTTAGAAASVSLPVGYSPVNYTGSSALVGTYRPGCSAAPVCSCTGQLPTNFTAPVSCTSVAAEQTVLACPGGAGAQLGIPTSTQLQASLLMSDGTTKLMSQDNRTVFTVLSGGSLVALSSSRPAAGAPVTVQVRA